MEDSERVSDDEQVYGTPVFVLLPSHSHSFTIPNVPDDSTVQDLKTAIFEHCPGYPKQSGQRIIVKGRVLADDEVLSKIWEPPSELRTVHLAVHPSAWSNTPPSSPRRQTLSFSAPSSIHLPTLATTPALPPASTDPPLPIPLQLSSLPTEFITHIHANALRILSGQTVLPWNGSVDLVHAKAVAKSVIRHAGLGWAPVFDEEIPTTVEVGKGIQYTSVIIDNLPYLALASNETLPTPVQQTALKMLTHTFPLLPLLQHLPTPNPPRQRARTVSRRFGVNIRLQPDPRNRDDADDNGILVDDENPRDYFPPVPEFRFQFNFHLPPARLIIQLLMTLGRAALFMYFFTPARKPLWAACIVAWMGWEVYVVLRHAGRERRREQGGGDDPVIARDDGGGNAGVGAPDAGGPAVAGQAGPVNQGRLPPNRGQQFGVLPVRAEDVEQVVERLATVNLATESSLLTRSIADLPPPPSAPTEGAAPVVPPRRPERSSPAYERALLHRIGTFFFLLVVSLVPAIWDRRRARIREREGWVRDMFAVGRPLNPTPTPPPNANGAEGEEAPVPPPQPSGTDEAARRREGLPPGWQTLYVERVLEGDIGDDAELAEFM